MNAWDVAGWLLAIWLLLGIVGQLAGGVAVVVTWIIDRRES